MAKIYISRSKCPVGEVLIIVCQKTLGHCDHKYICFTVHIKKCLHFKQFFLKLPECQLPLSQCTIASFGCQAEVFIEPYQQGPKPYLVFGHFQCAVFTCKKRILNLPPPAYTVNTSIPGADHLADAVPVSSYQYLG